MTERVQDYFRQFMRNDKWGTCGDCPKDSSHHVYPEFCKYYYRYDHQLNINQLINAYCNESLKL